MSIVVRKAEIKDIPRILDLLEEIARFHVQLRPDMFRPNTKKYFHHDIEEMLKNEKKPIFVAVSPEDKVLGYCFCVINRFSNHEFYVDHSTLFIDDFCVDETIRGQGIGHLLFDFVKKYATSNHFTGIELNVWESNVHGKHFYQDLGMTTQFRRMELKL